MLTYYQNKILPSKGLANIIWKQCEVIFSLLVLILFLLSKKA